jgi:hypothetical protein
MKITELISDSGATPGQIQAIEEQIGFELPDDYRRFLAEVNGGRPQPREFEGPNGNGSVMHFFFTADPAAPYYVITSEIEMYEDRIPKGLLPIGGDPFGNLVLLDLGARSVGSVYFWEHEEENMEGDPYWDNISFIAPSFTEFIGSLH